MRRLLRAAITGAFILTLPATNAAQSADTTAAEVRALAELLSFGDCAVAMAQWTLRRQSSDERDVAIAYAAGVLASRKGWGCFTTQDDKATLVGTLANMSVATTIEAQTGAEVALANLLGEDWIEILARSGFTPLMMHAAERHFFCSDPTPGNPLLEDVESKASAIAEECARTNGVAEPVFERGLYWFAVLARQSSWTPVIFPMTRMVTTHRPLALKLRPPRELVQSLKARGVSPTSDEGNVLLIKGVAEQFLDIYSRRYDAESVARARAEAANFQPTPLTLE